MIIEPMVRGLWAEWRARSCGAVDFKRSAEAIETMAQVPILGVIGANGGGKSLLCVLLSMRSLAAGRKVLSTVRLLDWENPRECPGGQACDDPEGHVYRGGRVHRAAHPLYVRWEKWGQLADMAAWSLKTEEGFDVFADEVTGVAGSRDSTGLPKVAQNALVQLRRCDAVFRWSAPAAGRADLLLREVSQGIVTAVGYRSKVDAASGRMWPQRRLFHWVMRDVSGTPDFTWSQLLESERVADAWFWGPLSSAQSGYDTFGAVSTVGRVTGLGTCEVCDGSRRRHECVCSDYLTEKAGLAEARAAGSPRSGVQRTLATLPSSDGRRYAS